MIDQTPWPQFRGKTADQQIDDLAISIATLGQAYEGVEGAEEAYIEGELTLRLLASLDGTERLLRLGAPERVVLRAIERLQAELLQAARMLAPTRCH